MIGAKLTIVCGRKDATIDSKSLTTKGIFSLTPVPS